LPPPTFHDHLGQHPQENGKWFYGMWVENGRIRDLPDRPVRTALRKIIAEHRPGIRLTGQQNVLFTDLDEPAIARIEQTLRAHGIATVGELSAARRHMLACPALPTCGLALAESERLMPTVVSLLEQELAGLGLREVPITLRMTGCPNGCARPYTADIAFVGRRPDVYHIYVGGGLPGDRVADLYAADVPTANLVNVLRPLLVRWAKDRRVDEGLGDFYQRLMERTEPKRSITGKEQPTQASLSPGAPG
jgi:sulfite reductase beta subunit-like hemoprotein